VGPRKKARSPFAPENKKNPGFFSAPKRGAFFSAPRPGGERPGGPKNRFSRCRPHRKPRFVGGPGGELFQESKTAPPEKGSQAPRLPLREVPCLGPGVWAPEGGPWIKLAAESWPPPRRAPGPLPRADHPKSSPPPPKKLLPAACVRTATRRPAFPGASFRPGSPPDFGPNCPFKWPGPRTFRRAAGNGLGLPRKTRPRPPPPLGLAAGPPAAPVFGGWSGAAHP